MQSLSASESMALGLFQGKNPSTNTNGGKCHIYKFSGAKTDATTNVRIPFDCPQETTISYRPSVIYKHIVPDNSNHLLGDYFTIKNAAISTFGMTFETSLSVSKCPPGYYCPNKIPSKLTGLQSASLSSYYDVSLGNQAVLQVPCSNFPFNGKDRNSNQHYPMSDTSGASNNNPTWYDYQIHGNDYGSKYRYFCPGGTPFPKEVSGTNKCSSQFINNNRYLPSSEGPCPGIDFTGTASSTNCNYGCDKKIDVGNVQYPSRKTFVLTTKNPAGADGTSLSAGIISQSLSTSSQYHETSQRWLELRVEPGQQKKMHVTINNDETIDFEFNINTGEMPMTAINVKQTANIQFWWSAGDMYGTAAFNVSVTPKENARMLVFPFSIQKEVRAGEMTSDVVYIFNIAATNFYPYMKNTTILPPWLTVSGDKHNLPAYDDTTTNGLYQGRGVSTLEGVYGANPYYSIATKKFQRLTISFNGNAKSRSQPYTRILKFATYNVGADQTNPSNEEAELPISLIITPGTLDVTQTNIKYDVIASQYHGSTNCYVDCKSVIPSSRLTSLQKPKGYSSKDRFWGDAISSNPSDDMNNIPKDAPKYNCYTDFEEPATKECGGCTIFDGPIYQCSGINKAKLKTVRNSDVELVIQPRDQYDTKTNLESGETIEISLCRGTDICTNAEANSYGGSKTVASSNLDGTHMGKIQARNPGLYNLSVILVKSDINNPGQFIKKHLSGSPLLFNSTDIKCKDHASPNEEGSHCLCEPGYYANSAVPGSTKDQDITCVACSEGQYKSSPGDEKCITCATGKVSTIGAANCNFCPGGYEASGLKGCSACTAGTFRKEQREDSDNGGTAVTATKCEQCQTGFVATTKRSERCEMCDGGSQANAAGTGCDQCAVGTFRLPQGSKAKGGVFHGGMTNISKFEERFFLDENGY